MKRRVLFVLLCAVLAAGAFALGRGTLRCTLTRDCFSSTANGGCGTLFLIPVSRDCTEIRVQERQGAWLES